MPSKEEMKMVGVNERRREIEKELFSKGLNVEVSSDEDGFKGSWFVATILETPFKPKSASKKKNHHEDDTFLVEYHTLVADDDGSKPLQELVKAPFLRPLAPLPEETESVVFELHDIVDAFYRDGWWTGVITAVLEGSKFRVFFHNPPEEVEFDRSEIRVHQDWVNGKWVRSEKQRTTGFYFTTGAAVEVSLGKETSQDVWFPAIVCKEIGDSSFVVQYQSSENGDEASTVKATVDSIHIRPSPPDLGDKNFALLEKVDAFFEHGWWSGIITKVLTGRRYTVFFKQKNKEMDFNHSQIRPRMEWTDGKWLNGSQEVVITSNPQEQLGQARCNSNNTEAAIELETSGAAKSSTEEKTIHSTDLPKDQVEKFSPFSEKSPYVVTSCKKKIKHTDHNSDGTLSQPSKKLKKGNASEVPFSFTACQSRMMPIQALTKEFSDSATPTTGGTRTNRSKKTEVGDQPSARTKSNVWRKKFETKRQRVSVQVNQKTDLVNRKRGRPPKSLVKSPRVSASGNNARKVEVPEESPKLMRGQKEPAKSKSMEIKQVKVGVRTQLKKRGRPRKVVIESLTASVAGEAHNGARGATDEMVVPASFEDLVSNIMRTPVVRKEKLLNETVAEVFGKELEGQSSKRGRKRSISIKDSQDAFKEKTAEVTATDCMTNKVDKASPGISNNTADDDRPLSAWFEGMHSPTIVDGPKISPVRPVEAREQQDGSVMQSCAVDAAADNVQDKCQSLLFMKSSPIWKSIESLEVFQMMPQNPHFHPLDKYKEEYREGFAIGSMVTFASLVEKISKLQFDEPRSTFDNSLDALLELEMQGFDVKAVRGRLNELLSFKDKQAKLQDQSKDIERQLLEHSQDKSKIDEELYEIDKKITELQDKRAVALSMKESKDSEIAMTRSSADNINEDIRSTQLNFEKVAAAPW